MHNKGRVSDGRRFHMDGFIMFNDQYSQCHKRKKNSTV